MAGVRFTDVQSRPTAFLDVTSVAPGGETPHDAPVSRL
jgi:hypothetical protein